MHSPLHALAAAVPGAHRERATLADLQNVIDRLDATLRTAGAGRRPLLDVANEVGPATRILSALAADHRRLRGRSPAVRIAEAAVCDALSLEYQTRPMGRYLPDQYLRRRLWDVVRKMQRACITLRWEQVRRSSSVTAPW
ncbi:MAG TPA: hypothetical protein VFB58_01815 [Chloroflexota bacterium]|nr:hypothetical protein [Chloroflexota bacterium]